MSECRSWVTEYRTRATPLRRWVNGTLMVLGTALILWSFYQTFQLAVFIWLILQN